MQNNTLTPFLNLCCSLVGKGTRAGVPGTSTWTSFGGHCSVQHRAYRPGVLLLAKLKNAPCSVPVPPQGITDYGWTLVQALHTGVGYEFGRVVQQLFTAVYLHLHFHGTMENKNKGPCLLSLDAELEVGSWV